VFYTVLLGLLCVEFGWGIICLRDLPAIYQAPSLYCQKSIKLIIFGKSCFTHSCNFLNGSRDATACSEMSHPSTRCNSILIGQAVRPMGVAPPPNRTIKSDDFGGRQIRPIFCMTDVGRRNSRNWPTLSFV